MNPNFNLSTTFFYRTNCKTPEGSIYKIGSPIETITEDNLLDVYHVKIEKTISKNGYPLIHILENEDNKKYSF